MTGTVSLPTTSRLALVRRSTMSRRAALRRSDEPRSSRVRIRGRAALGTRSIWRYLLDMDWTARIKARCLPVDHPLLLLFAEPRRLRFNLRDGLWIRLVDVAPRWPLGPT